MLRQPVTQQQIQQYRQRIQNQGISAVSGVYQELYSQGYGYASWANGVATESLKF